MFLKDVHNMFLAVRYIFHIELYELNGSIL